MLPISVCLAAASASFCSAASIFALGDPILGGGRIGENFEVGSMGFGLGENRWPPAEPPEDLINGAIGGAAEKYFNFLRLDSGLIITPQIGPSIVTSMELWVANDFPNRDPSSFEVLGTNNPIAGDGPFPMAGFTLISEGLLSLPDDRDNVNDDSGFSQVVSIGDGTSYTAYMVLFPTVKGPSDAMQLSEIQFDGTVIPEPGSITLMLSGLGLALGRRKRLQRNRTSPGPDASS